jgi:predicted O-methyltransferase YrrM
MMNHFCNEIQGWFSYPELYANIVRNATEQRQYKFVEVGSWKGKSTAFMATEIINSGKDILFYSVDTWKGSDEHLDPNNGAYEPLLINDELYPTFLKNVAPAHKAIFPIRMESVKAAKIFGDESLDFVMVDAAHDYDNALADIKAWYPKLKKGGIMAGDDLDWPGVNKAVKEYFEFSGYYEQDNKLWMSVKT